MWFFEKFFEINIGMPGMLLSLEIFWLCINGVGHVNLILR